MDCSFDTLYGGKEQNAARDIKNKSDGRKCKSIDMKLWQFNVIFVHYYVQKIITLC